MFFTTPRPRPRPRPRPQPRPQAPLRVPDEITIFSRPNYNARPTSTQPPPNRTPSSAEHLITFQDILEGNRRRPLFSASHSSADSQTASTASHQTLGLPHVTSYTGVREPQPPKPPADFRFPLDRFRYPSTSYAVTTMPPATEPTVAASSFNIWDFLTTRKPLILNTEVVTSTSIDVQYGSTSSDQGTTQYGPVYRPTSELAPVYRPTIDNGPVYRPDQGTTDEYGPVYRPSSEPAPLKEFSGDQNFLTVPVISGTNVRYITMNKTRTNYPNVVIVNLQATPEAETTTPETSSRGDGRRFNTKFLEDIFQTVLRNTNYRGIDGATHFRNSGFSNRRGKPIDLDIPDSPAPLLDEETNESLSLWSVLRNLSQVYLSDPAIIQQLQDFEKAASQKANRGTTATSTSQSTTQDQTTTPNLTPFFQHLRGSQNPFLKNSNVVASQQAPAYAYIPLHDPDASERSDASTDDDKGPAPALNYTLQHITPRPASGVTYPMDYTPQPIRYTSSPFTTLFMTGVGGKSSGSPQVISVSSRSPVIPSGSSSMTNSPIHTFVLKEGQSMEDLLQEIFDTISLEEENEAFPSTDAPSSDVETTTEDLETTYQTTRETESRDSVLESINRILQQHLEKMNNQSKDSSREQSSTAPSTAPEPSPPSREPSKPHEGIDPIHDLFPVMTRPMNFIRTTTPKPYEILDDGDNEIKTTVVGDGMASTEEVRTETSIDVSYSVHSATTEIALINNDTVQACQSKSQFRCKSGECIAESSRCNLIQDCRDSSDERDCSCADFLKSKFLTRKICDGIVDCWDHSDESNCEWCKPGQFICPGTTQCIEQSQVCDGITDCKDGDDERTCVTIAPDVPAANSLDYHGEGYLMVRKHGVWGKLCLDNFEQVTSRASATWTVSDLGQAVCKTLTFSNFSRVERSPDTTLVKRSRPNIPSRYHSLLPPPDPAAPSPVYYEINVSDKGFLPTRARSVPEDTSSATDLTLSLDFEKTTCPRKDVVKVSCEGLQCGMRPRAVHHRARIVGGSNSGPGSWPWHAALYKEGEYQCGATLINDRWLVSAGHCFYSATNNHWVARLGALRRGSKFPSPYEQLRHITHIFIHPEYVETGFINDITLLSVNEPVRFTDYVRPVCLPPPGAGIEDGRLCTLVGWGQLFEVGRIFPDTLQEVQVPLISTSECRKRTVFIPLYRITDDMFCAGYDRGGRDACLGDSGGPLMCQEPNGAWQLVGVTSNGYGCARPHRPGVYTKVVNYLDWMNQVMELTKSELVVPVPAQCEGHRCPLGQCLSASNVCNGVVECSDGSDEAQCH
nr:serine protease nudel-like isoform X2 [Penaeus vannamei]